MLRAQCAQALHQPVRAANVSTEVSHRADGIQPRRHADCTTPMLLVAYYAGGHLQSVHMCQPSQMICPNQPSGSCCILLCRCKLQEERQLRPHGGSGLSVQPGLLLLPLRSQEVCWPGKGYLQWKSEGEHWRQIVRGFGLCPACFHKEACCTTGCKALRGL